MVLADSSRIPPVPPYSGYCSSSSIYAYGAITLYGSVFHADSTWWWFLNAVLQPSWSTLHKFRLFPVRSPLLRESFVIFFSSAYLDVSVQRVGFLYCYRMICLQHTRLSHSEIRGYNTRVQFPPAYRSLPRPSSPLRPKASTIRP